MAKYTVYISGMAFSSQSHVIEAENEEQARAIAMKPETYNNVVWSYNGIDEETVECDHVEGVN